MSEVDRLKREIRSFLEQQQHLTHFSDTSGMSDRSSGKKGKSAADLGNKMHNIKDLASQAQGRLIKVLQNKVAPFGLQLLISGIAYGSGIGIIQIIGAGLRVSCRSRVLAPCLGAIGVAMGSMLSGQATRHLRQQIAQGKSPIEAFKSPFWHGAELEEVLIDALSGMLLFKFAGGAFRRLMPSDLRSPGAFAYSNVPVSAADYASESQKAQLMRIFKRDGCHHCGTKRGPVIGDHIPPTKLVQDTKKSNEASLQDLPFLMRQIKLLFIKNDSLKQAYYAQCQRCSQSQAALMRHYSGTKAKEEAGRHRRSALVFHSIMVQPGLLPGLLVGLRQYIDLSPSSEGGSHGEGRKRDHVKRRSQNMHETGGEEGLKRKGIWSWVVRLAHREGVSSMAMLPEAAAAPSFAVQELPLGQDIFTQFDDNGPLNIATDESRALNIDESADDKVPALSMALM